MMNRRDILKAGAAGLAVLAVPKAAHAAEPSPNKGSLLKSYEKQPNQAAACGIFCGNCGELKEGRCHGCGCTCGKCNANDNNKHCAIIQCSAKKNVTHCGDCGGFACTNLIMNTFDPAWKAQAANIENLRHRKAVGTPAWIAEQKAFWSDENNARKWAWAEKEGKEIIEKLKKDYGYTKNF